MENKKWTHLRHSEWYWSMSLKIFQPLIATQSDRLYLSSWVSLMQPNNSQLRVLGSNCRSKELYSRTIKTEIHKIIEKQHFISNEKPRFLLVVFLQPSCYLCINQLFPSKIFINYFFVQYPLSLLIIIYTNKIILLGWYVLTEKRINEKT